MYKYLITTGRFGDDYIEYEVLCNKKYSSEEFDNIIKEIKEKSINKVSGLEWRVEMVKSIVDELKTKYGFIDTDEIIAHCNIDFL